MASDTDGLVRIDASGVARLAGTRARVIDLVLDQRAYGWTPEQIQEQHPHLSLAQINAGLAYYAAHRAEIDAEIERGLREVDELREKAGESPLAKRLKRLRACTPRP